MNIFTDKYFTKAKIIAKSAGLNPLVAYRIFARCSGLAAMEPLRLMVTKLLGDTAHLEVLREGLPFQAGDTLAIIRGRFQDLVEYEPLWLWWAILPSYCALEAQNIVQIARGGSRGNIEVMAFENRHNFSAEATALSSYGARVGGIQASSCEIAYDPLRYLEFILDHVYRYLLEKPEVLYASERAVGTMPHALLAIFHGDYVEACQAYKKAFPEERYIVLNDYNNREIDDSLTALRILGPQLYAVRCDTCGENVPQLQPGAEPAPGDQRGVSPELIKSLRGALDEAGGQHVKICASSGFDAQKLSQYHAAPLDIVGTGSFIPKWPIATADIFEVEGRPETKKGREWGLEKNQQFDRLMVRSSQDERR